MKQVGPGNSPNILGLCLLIHVHKHRLKHPMYKRTKLNKWNLIKLRSICTAKETINKTKRQSTEWEKIFGNTTTDKGLSSKIYKQLMQLIIKNKLNQKMGRRSKQIFYKDIQMVKKHIQRCSTLLITREVKIKTTVRYPFTPEWPPSKNLQ